MTDEKVECPYCDDAYIAENLSFGITYCRNCMKINALVEFAGKQMYFWQEDDE